MHCQVDPAHLLSVADVPNIYHVPLLLHAQGAHTILDNLLGLGLPSSLPGLAAWQVHSKRVAATAAVALPLSNTAPRNM